MSLKKNEPGGCISCGCGSPGNTLPGCNCTNTPGTIYVKFYNPGFGGVTTIPPGLVFVTTKPVYDPPMPDAAFSGPCYLSPGLFDPSIGTLTNPTRTVYKVDCAGNAFRILQYAINTTTHTFSSTPTILTTLSVGTNGTCSPLSLTAGTSSAAAKWTISESPLGTPGVYTGDV